MKSSVTELYIFLLRGLVLSIPIKKKRFKYIEKKRHYNDNYENKFQFDSIWNQ